MMLPLRNSWWTLFSLWTILLLQWESYGDAFAPTTTMEQQRRSAALRRLYGASTVEAPTRTDRSTRRDSRSNEDSDDRSKKKNRNDDIDNYQDLEYYMDPSVSREMNEPFHILLLGAVTFARPKITVEYVSRTLEYVLGLPYAEAMELSQFAKDEQSMACLGTWTREQCLSFGKQLQQRDVACRVVPFCIGGPRGWQAKDAAGSYSNSEV